jgi:AbrB family looped-hinge helix DNA binding protein
MYNVRNAEIPKRGNMEMIQIRAKGTVTLPAALRRKYKLNEGDVMTLIDLGEGCVLLVPKVSKVAGFGDEIRKIMNEKGVYETDLTQVLDEEREEYYRKNYGSH